MKKILLFGIAVMLVMPAMAQTYGGKTGAQRGVISQAKAPNSGLFPELKTQAAEPVIQEEETSDTIKLIIDNVQIMTPPMGGHSVCYGTLTAKNDTNTLIKSLKITVKYGSLNNPLSFGSMVPDGGLNTQLLAFAGENCKHLIEIPTIEVTSCEGAGLNASVCQGKIEYVPFKR